ncbi:MAG: rhamnulokinase [Bacillota bacterium]
MLKLLAFDYGASSGRAILGKYDGERLVLSEVHRFPNNPVMVSGSLYWDVLRLFQEMKNGILSCVRSGDGDISSIGTDTWGVDFGLIGPSGELLGNPFHYRDSRTEGMIEKISGIVPKREIYERTGISFEKFNTLYQIFSMKESKSVFLEKASSMLFMPDLLNYFLTGEKTTEFTIASTSQMLDANTGNWAWSLLERLGIPANMLGDITMPGSIVGRIRSDVCSELNVGEIPVVAVAEHDTESAVMSIPAAGPRYAYLSSGTWSLLGVEADKPVINDMTYKLNYSNEGGFNRKTVLLKNIMGLWIFQECKRSWDREGKVMGYDELEQIAEKSEPFKFFIDPDNDMFYSPGQMPEKVKEFCRITGQGVPGDKASIVRCVMESLAMKYRSALEGLEHIIGYEIPVLHIVGGGSRNEMLNRFTANAIKKPVTAGPAEATAIGNLACQLVALGEVNGQEEAREIVRRSFPTREYLPAEQPQWDEAYEKYKKITGN